MKKILAGVAFAGLMAAPVMADTPASERPPAPEVDRGARQAIRSRRTDFPIADAGSIHARSGSGENVAERYGTRFLARLPRRSQLKPA